MIYSVLILIILLSLYPIHHCFYITNAAVVEQCATNPITYINKFDATKMHCFNQQWRQVFIFLEYSCFQNALTRLWTLQTTANKIESWPQEIDVFTGPQDYTSFNKFSANDDPTIEENSDQFDPNHNQLTTYIWTSSANEPQCRIRYTIVKDVCAGKQTPLGAKLSDAVCYYGQQKFNLQAPDQRQALDHLLDSSIQGHGNPSDTNAETNSQQGLHLSPIAALESPFWQKHKRYIIIAGAAILVMLIAAIVFLILRRRQSPNEDIDQQISEESNIE